MKQVRIFVILLSLMTAVSTVQSAFAQEKLPGGKVRTIEDAMKLTKGGQYIMGRYKITKPLSFMATMNGSIATRADPTKHKVTLEIIPFGNKGTTVLAITDLGAGGIFTATWSGKNVKVCPGYDSGKGILAIVRNNSVICGSLWYDDGKWYLMFNQTEKAYMIGDFNKGMTRSVVEEKATKGLGLSKFKFTRKEGNFDVYSLFWLNQEKRYNLLGTDYRYELNNNKNYGDFYFDSNGKLVKWFLYM